MKTLNATFSNSDDASKAIEALKDAGVPELDITSDTLANGATVVDTRVDDSLFEAAAAILKSGSINEVEEEIGDSIPVVDEPNVADHPEGPSPIITPVAPNR